MVEVYLAVSNNYNCIFIFYKYLNPIKSAPPLVICSVSPYLAKTFQSCIKNAQLGANRTENP